MLDPAIWGLIGRSILETFYMVLVSTFMSYVIGLPLGVLLAVTDKDGITPCSPLYAVLGFVINVLRSVPFLILMMTIQPLTRAIVGTVLGSTATIVPLVVGASPFIARMVESSLKEVDQGVIEAATSIGCSPTQIILKVLLPEARPSLTVGAAISITTILGYSAMAGFVGGGGLGAVATNYGYYRYQSDVMLIIVIILVIIVQIFQEVGMRISRRYDKRIR
ncbi:MAG: ABC transporter permease [Clostridia bacterium]|nr:ABC transporter permease [Clostridia bacterium]